MSSKSTIVTVLIFGLICISGSCVLLLKEDNNSTKIQSFQSEKVTVTPTSTTGNDKCVAVLNQKTTATGSEHLSDKTFYFSDYKNSTASAIEEACEYAENSNEDYFLTYEENKATGQIVGMRFEKSTEELERKYGSTTE